MEEGTEDCPSIYFPDPGWGALHTRLREHNSPLFESPFLHLLEA